MASALLAACASPPDESVAGPHDGCAADLAFTDITDESPELSAHPYGGLSSWGHADKYAPGVALADLDGSGDLDLVQPRNDREDPDLRPLVIYRGLGDGRFEAAAWPPWEASWNATAVVVFDYDADGDADLFVGIDGDDSRLYRNEGNFEFVDATESAGLEGVAERVYAAAAGDVTGNGLPDLYLGVWKADLPDHGEGEAPNLLLENRGDGRFFPSDADVGCEGASTLGVSLVDLDADGDLDIYVANDFFPDCLYENRGGGRFRDIGAEAGIRLGAHNGMGVGVGDLEGTGRLDLVVTDTQTRDPSPGNAVYRQREGAPLRFESVGQDLGLDGLSQLPPGEDWMVSWGVGIEDFSGDGRSEVHVATHGERSELVFSREGDRFAPVPAAMEALGDADARGSAYGDIDGDGDLDVVVGRRGAPLQVIRNDSGGRYLSVAVEPVHRALGGVVTAEIAGERRVSPIPAGSSYMSSSPPIARFGLCDAKRARRVWVTAPDGARARAEDVPEGRLQLELGAARETR